MDLRIFSDPKEVTRAAADEFLRIATEAVAQTGLFTVALSGGSTPKALYSLLADDAAYRDRLPCNQMYLFWGDERTVPPDHADSNYRMTREAMLSKLPIPEENIHRIRAENGDAKKAAEDYENELKRFFNPGPGELPRLDLVLLGMGPDGHTASIFPYTSAVEERERLVADVYVEKLQTHRVTLTVPVLNHAIHVLFLACGAEKADTLKAVLQGERSPSQYPSQLIKPAYGKLTWMVDRAAAGKLG